MIAMAQSSSQRDPIVFTDKWVECSRVVKSALDIIYSSVVGEITEDNINSHLYVLDFARKWDITIIPILMGNYVRLAVTKNGCLAFELLIVSLKMKDNDLATIAFGATDREEWNQEQDFYPAPTESTELDDDSMTVLPPNYESAPYPEYDCLEDSHGGDIFDLGASSLQWFLRLPPTVVWIILRSQHLVSKDHKDLRPQKVAKYFGDLMNTICKFCPAQQCRNQADIRSSRPVSEYDQEKENGGLRDCRRYYMVVDMEGWSEGGSGGISGADTGMNHVDVLWFEQQMRRASPARTLVTVKLLHSNLFTITLT